MEINKKNNKYFLSLYFSSHLYEFFFFFFTSSPLLIYLQYIITLKIINFYKVYFQRSNQNSDNPRMLNIRDMLIDTNNEYSSVKYDRSKQIDSKYEFRRYASC